MRQRIRTITAAVLLLAIVAQSVPVFAADGHKVIIGGQQAQLANPIINIEGRNFAAMSEILALLGAEVKWDENTKTVTAVREGNEISVEIGAKNAVVNGKAVEMDAPARIVDGRTYVPLAFVGKALGYTVEYSPDSKQVTLKTVDEATAGLSVDFKTRYDTDLTFDEAYKRAASQSNELKTLDANLKNAKTARDDAVENNTYLFQNISSSQYVPGVDVDTPIRKAMEAVASTESNMANIPLSKQIKEDALALSIKSSLLSIVSTQNDIALGEASLELAKIELEHSKLSHELGLISDAAYESAKMTYEQNVEKQKMTERSLDGVYLALNKLLGYDSTKRYNAVIDDKYEPMDKNFLLESFVASSVAKAPTVKIAENTLTQAKRSKDLYSGSTESEWQKTLSAINTADRDLGDTKRELEKSIRTAYSSLKDFEAQISNAELDLEQLRTNLQTAKINYETGSITELALLKAHYAVDSAEKSIDLSKLQYCLSKYTFLNYPYLASASSQNKEE